MERRHRDLILVALLCIVSYHNIFGNAFVWDDHTFIAESSRSLRLSNLLRFYELEDIGDLYIPSRPVKAALYMLTHFVWGLNPFGYHLSSLFVHISCTILVYLIADLAFGKEEVSLMSALLFAAHPVHTEAITFISPSFDNYGILFLLLSMYLYILSRGGEARKELYALSVAFSLLAFFTYEMALTLPLLLILYDFCFKPGRDFKIARYNPYFGVALLYFFIRFFVLGVGARSGYLMDSPYITALTMSTVFVKYVQLLLIPVALSVVHSAPIPRSIFELEVLGALALILLYCGASLFAFRRSKTVFFCMAWFFITLLPTSNLMVPTKVVMAERYLYLPSIGFCILIALAFLRGFDLKKARESKRVRATLYICFILILSAYTTQTIKQNRVWKDDITLWSNAVEVSPNSDIVHLNLGLAYAWAGKNADAIKEYRRSLEINPKNYMAHNNLGSEYLKLGRYDDAMNEFYTAISLNPEYYEARANLGSVFLYKGEFSESIAEFKKAALLRQKDAKLHSALSIAYFYTGQYNLALVEAERAVELEPENEKYRRDLDLIENSISPGRNER